MIRLRYKTDTQKRVLTLPHFPSRSQSHSSILALLLRLYRGLVCVVLVLACAPIALLFKSEACCCCYSRLLV